MFFMFRLLPGDPIGVMASADLPPEARDALRAAWGLGPAAHNVQFVDYMRNLLTGDFGLSFAYQQPVWQVLGPKVLNTLMLVIPSTDPRRDRSAAASGCTWPGFSWQHG